MSSASEPGSDVKQPHSDRREVDIRLPASSEFVAPLRALTRSLASQCELTVDEIEDLQIAVDEACALLLPHSRVGGALLTAHFGLAAGEVRVQTSVRALDGADPDRNGFSWTALVALADDVDVRFTDGELSICVTKRREAQAQ